MFVGNRNAPYGGGAKKPAVRRASKQWRGAGRAGGFLVLGKAGLNVRRWPATASPLAPGDSVILTHRGCDFSATAEKYRAIKWARSGTPGPEGMH
jgi:hypothetical protein